MDTHRVFPTSDRGAGGAFAADWRLTLAVRLAALRQRVERADPISLALDLVNASALNALPADLADAIYRLVEEAVANAVRHAAASLVRVTLQSNGGVVLLSIADDGRGFPFTGVYDAAILSAFGVGPQALLRQVAMHGGSLTLSSSPSGARLDIVLPRTTAARPTAAPQPAAA